MQIKTELGHPFAGILRQPEIKTLYWSTVETKAIVKTIAILTHARTMIDAEIGPDSDASTELGKALVVLEDALAGVGLDD